ncbi:MAG TPA: hypothetical protein VFR08_15240 [Candidatus Angelobacter sp.]|nr:hypothetical protein [Candidatus Angelobacter sp.]
MSIHSVNHSRLNDPPPKHYGLRAIVVLSSSAVFTAMKGGVKAW